MIRKVFCLVMSFCIVMAGIIVHPVPAYADPGSDTGATWLLPSEDAQISQNNPDSNYNYGSVNTAPGDVGLLYTYLRNPSSATANSNIVYMKFDISEIDTDAINKAEIRIYAKNSRANSYDKLEVYGVENNNWQEDTITWNNAPVNDFSTALPIDALKVIVDFYKYYYADITDYLIEQHNNGKTQITLAFQPENTYYNIRMESKNRVGGDSLNPNPPYLVINREENPPTAPQNLKAEAVYTEAIELTWERSTDDTGIFEYEIYKDGELTQTVGSDVLSCIIGDLQPSTTYSFYVKAVDNSWNKSGASVAVTVRTLNLPDEEPPGVPQNLHVKVLSDSRVRLTWEPSTDNIGIDGYTVFCDGEEFASIDRDGYLGYEIRELSAGTEYTFSVEAFDFVRNRSGQSAVVTGTTLSERDVQPPQKPTNLQLGGLSIYSSEATLTWDPSPDNVETMGYIIYVNGYEKARTDGNTTSYQLTGLTPYTEYSIYIKAFDYAGNMSEASDMLTKITGYVTKRTVGQGKDYSTISAALSAANPGDVILVYDGTYTESLTINKSGTSDQWITVRAEGDAAFLHPGIKIKGSYIRFAGFKMDGLIDGIYAGTDGVRVSGTYVQAVDNNIINIKGVPFYCETTSNNLYIAGNYTNKTKGFTTSYASDSVFEGNEIVNLDMHGSTSGDMDYFRIFGQNVIVRNNYAHDTVGGPHIGEAHLDYFQAFDNHGDISKNILIENNVFTSYCHQGFMLSNQRGGPSGVFNVSDWTVRNNVFSGFHSFGVCAGYPNGGIPNLTFENNLFIGDPDAKDGTGALQGIYIRGSGGSAAVRNNIIMNVSGGSYATKDGAVLTKTGNNLIFNAKNPNISPTDIVGIDPLFADPDNNDFRLQPGSPAIDAGAEVSFQFDIEGNARLSGNGYDIGPYEYYAVPVEAESVNVIEEDITLEVGMAKTLAAAVLPTNATNKVLVWESSDPSVATVDQNGTVTAVSEGSAVITATVAGTTFSDICSVLVASAQENLPPVFEVIGDKSVNVGSTIEFTVSATDPDGDQMAYSATYLPNGAAFDAQTRTFSWTPQEGHEGEYQVTFAVSDGFNPSVETAVGITVNPATAEYDFSIEDVSIDKGTGIAVEATVVSNIAAGRNAVVIFKLMKTDGTVIGLYSSELYIEDDSVFKVKFHGYSGDEYKVKVFVWDKLDDSTEDIGESLAVPVEIP